MNTEQIVTGANKCCPHCEQELTADEIKRLWSNYTTSLRQTLGGPEKKKRPCQSCGMICASAREAWSHCRIPRNLDAAALLAHVLGRVPKELAGMVGDYFEDLEALEAAVGDIVAGKLKPAERKQAQWFAGYVDKAMGKLENVI